MRPNEFYLCPDSSPRPFGGDEEDRTPDPLRARQVLSQLSYTPILQGFRLILLCFFQVSVSLLFQVSSKLNSLTATNYLADRIMNLFFGSCLHRKEVIQPHLPIRLPCYDFTPVIDPTFGSAPLAVRLLTSGVTNSHGVTGGVYKARERIHRGMLIRDY